MAEAFKQWYDGLGNEQDEYDEYYAEMSFKVGFKAGCGGGSASSDHGGDSGPEVMKKGAAGLGSGKKRRRYNI